MLLQEGPQDWSLEGNLDSGDGGRFWNERSRRRRSKPMARRPIENLANAGIIVVSCRATRRMVVIVVVRRMEIRKPFRRRIAITASAAATTVAAPVGRARYDEHTIIVVVAPRHRAGIERHVAHLSPWLAEVHPRAVDRVAWHLQKAVINHSVMLEATATPRRSMRVPGRSYGVPCHSGSR